MDVIDTPGEQRHHQGSAEGQGEDEGEYLWAVGEEEAEREAELFMAATEENLRFAAELMDNIGQLVLLARIKLDIVAEKNLSCGVAPVIQRVRALLDQALTEIRVLLSQLTPPLLAELGLEYSLKHLCRQVGDDRGLRVGFADDGSEKPLAELTRSIVYHAARETLFRVMHDAKTSQVKLSVGRAGSMLQLLVEDRGGGYDYAETVLNHREIGGGTICHCIRRLGGEIRFLSLPDRRAAIRIRVPLAPRDGRGDGHGG